MKYWKTTLCLIVMLLLFTACRSEEAGQNDETPTGGSSAQAKLNLSEAVAELAIWQIGQGGSEQIATYTDELPDEPVTWSVHEPEVVLKLQLQPNTILETNDLKKHIRLTGAEYEVASGEEPGSYEVKIREIEDEAELVLGDLKKIRLVRKDAHLLFTLNPSNLRIPFSLQIPGEADGHIHLFVSEEESYVVIRFTEPMQRIERPGSEWLSDTQLKIELGTVNFEWLLADYRSRDGNFLDRQFHSIMIHQTPSRSWFDAASGGNAGWSKRDAYYDALIFSPDGNKYAGLVELSEDEDGGGAYYGIVIERNGQAPMILERSVHVRDDSVYLPIEWLDSHTLLYLSSYELWAYDVESGAARQLVADDEQQVIAYQVDRRNDRLYVLTQMSILENGQAYERGSMTVYNREMEIIEAPQVISDLWPSAENGIMPLAIAMTSNGYGYYLTTYRDGQIVTSYNSGVGEKASATGRLIGVTSSGAYLAEVAEDGDTGRLFWWPLSGEPEPVTPIDATGYIMFGGDLFAYREGMTNTYYGYHVSAGSWVEWSPNDGRDSWIPKQRTAYYRVTD